MIKVSFKGAEHTLEGNTTVRKIIAALGLNPESVLAMRDGKLIVNETFIGKEAEIRLISVVSGG